MDMVAILVMYPRLCEQTFVPLIQVSVLRNMASSPVVSETFKMLMGDRVSVAFIKGQRMALTFSNMISSSGHLIKHIYMYQILYLTLKKFLRKPLFEHFCT